MNSFTGEHWTPGSCYSVQASEGRSDPLSLPTFYGTGRTYLFLTSGIPIRTFQAEFTIFTDASTQGWGAHMGDSQISGNWTRTDRKLHINSLEL